MSIRVAFAARHDFLSNFGGDSVQLLKTKKYLEKVAKIKVDIINEGLNYASGRNYDILHIFNLQTADAALHYINLYKNKVSKIVVSTIYWNLWHALFVNFYFRLFRTLKGAKYFTFMESIYRKFINKFNFNEQYLDKLYIEKRKKIIEIADLLLPNSYEEIEWLSKDFRIPYNYLLNKSFVIPNAIDQELSVKSSEPKNNNIEYSGYILCVARIEPVKNQLGILEALYDIRELPILFIGRPSDYNYFKKIIDISRKRGNVYHIESIDHDSIYEYYKRALVHALPSFRESPGLATLEALSVGCKVVVSSYQYCPLKYYGLDKVAFICNPYDFSSIRKAIIKAISSPSREYNIANYTYERAAQLTLEAYIKVLDSNQG